MFYNSNDKPFISILNIRNSVRRELSTLFTVIVTIMTILFVLSNTSNLAFASDPGGTFFPRLAIDSNGDVHSVYWSAASQGNEIYYFKWDGTTGEPIIEDYRVTFAGGFSGRPDIEIDSQDQVHIVWLDRRDGGTNAEIYYEKLLVDGAVVESLVHNKRLTFADGASVRPSLIIDSQDNIHVAWYDDRDDGEAGGVIGDVSSNHEIYYKKTDNNGTTLIDDIRVTDAEGLSQRPYIDVDSNDDVHISFMDQRDGGNYEMYYTKLDGDTGAKLVPDFRLTNNTFLSGRNALVVDSLDNVWITFMNGDFPIGNLEINLVKLDNDGNPLMDDNNDGLPDLIEITKNSLERSVRPDMSIDLDDNIHISWVEERDGTSTGNREIYYEKVDNNGNTLDLLRN